MESVSPPALSDEAMSPTKEPMMTTTAPTTKAVCKANHGRATVADVDPLRRRVRANSRPGARPLTAERTGRIGLRRSPRIASPGGYSSALARPPSPYKRSA